MLSLIETVKDYIEAMLGELPGRKALIMDKETLSNQNTFNLSNFSDRFSSLLTDTNPLERRLLHRDSG